jgi:hypothetical protein
MVTAMQAQDGQNEGQRLLFSSFLDIRDEGQERERKLRRGQGRVQEVIKEVPSRQMENAMWRLSQANGTAGCSLVGGCKLNRGPIQNSGRPLLLFFSDAPTPDLDHAQTTPTRTRHLNVATRHGNREKALVRISTTHSIPRPHPWRYFQDPPLSIPHFSSLANCIGPPSSTPLLTPVTTATKPRGPISL